MTMASINFILKTVTAALFAVSIMNCALLLYQRNILSKWVPCADHDICKDDSELAELPGRFQDVAMTVEKNDLYSVTDDKAWKTNFPPARGFVRLGPKGRAFATAFVHQMHCLNSIRFSYTVARDGLVKDPAILKAKFGHDNHCFQFLRQSILCKADHSLVPLNSLNVSLAAAGFDVSHRCRDWIEVRRFIAENNEKWMGVDYLEEDGMSIVTGN